MKKSKSRRKANYKPCSSAEQNIQKEKLSPLMKRTFQRGRSYGFDYYLAKDTIKKYREKLPELRLKWLYLGNLFRMGYPKATIRMHNKFRDGK